MKVLLIGMDGAHIGAFKRGWTPFIESLINNGTNLNLKNDLVSRGWLEIATGQHASVTGAMYDKPKADGTHQWNLKFNINDIPNLGTEVKPIWQAINELGYRVGIMNLPTVFPAPKVNGFFVSGGGGGAPVVATPTQELCYPKEILDTLIDNGYIVDQRIPQHIIDKKYTTSTQIIEAVTDMEKRRTPSFIQLAKEFNIDFGFVTYKPASIMVERFVLPKSGENKRKKIDIDTDELSASKNYYVEIDKEIEKLCNEFPTADVILVSDHGTITRFNTVNPNIFLQRNGYQKAKSGLSLKKIIINKLKEMLPFSLKMALKKNSSLKNIAAESIDFDGHNSVAFCRTKNDWSHGIFINDKVRFGGPVDVSDIAELRKEIIQKINSNSEAVAHKIRAYSSESKTIKPLAVFPDILLDMPSGYLTNDSSKVFIDDYSAPNNLTTLAGILRGDITSMKSHEPLSIIAKGTEDVPEKLKTEDLTIIYNIIVNKFRKLKSS